jgi:lipopolysaccharide/colanic/teichoic acid biosynthesis glycosyltransferase
MTDAALSDAGLTEAVFEPAENAETHGGAERQQLEVLDGSLERRCTAVDRMEALVKRSLDLLVATILLLCCLPVFAAIAVAIWSDTGVPITFRAARLGKDGCTFTMYKFRTMVKDAPALLSEYSHLNLGVGMVKIPNDPRVTRTGRWLRAFSLDELPQLWNVIRGDMSLVGPRPHDVGELSLSDSAHRLRLSVRPGLTGLWQVAARDDPQLSTRVHHDLSYVQNWSLWADAKIVCRTIPVVLKGCGDRIAPPERSVVRESSSN